MPGTGKKKWRRAAWAVLVLLLLAGAAGAFATGSAKRERLVREATASAATQVHTVLEPELRGEDVRSPMVGQRYEDIADLVARRITAGGPVRAVRIWSPDGTLVFSDDEKLVGRQNKQMRTSVLGTLGDGARSEVVKDDLRTLVPMGFGAGDTTEVAVELDRPYAPIAAEADSPWRLLMLLAIGGAVLAALMLVRSIRESTRGQAVGFGAAEGGPGAETGSDLRTEVEARKRAEAELARVEGRAKGLQQEMDATRAALAAAEHGLEEHQGAARELERTLGELAKVEERAKEGEAQREAMRKELDTVRTQLASTQAETRSAREEIERLLAAATAQASEEPEPPTDDESASIRAELDAARTELESAKALATELGTVQAQLTAAKEHARSLTLRAEEAEASAAAAESARQSVDEELAAVRAEVTHLRAQLEASAQPTEPESGGARFHLARLREILADDQPPSTNGDGAEDASKVAPSTNGSTQTAASV